MSVLQKLLNLPDREAGETMLHRNPSQKRRKTTTPEPAPQSAATTNRWESAATSPQPRPEQQPPPEDERAADVAPWHHGESIAASNSQRWWVRALRIAALAALAIVVLSGIRTIFFPRQIEVPPAHIPAAALYPEATASGFAVRIAGAYGTWHEDTAEQRTKALAEAGGAGLESTWDGRGVQTFTDLTVAGVSVSTSTEGVVTVVGQLTPSTRTPDGSGWNTDQGKAHRVGLRVPVTVRDGNAGLGGPMTWVAPPVPPAPPAAASVIESDSTLTQQTRPVAQEFFSAYGDDDDLGAIVAPGSTVRGLGGAAKIDQILTWTVGQPKDDRAVALAKIRWAIGPSSHVEQTYSVVLVPTTGSGGRSRWQVESLTT